MSYVSNRIGQDGQADGLARPRRRILGRHFYLVLALGFAAGLINDLSSDPVHDGSRISAGQFPWPNGCKPLAYQAGDRLPKPCFDRFQKLSHRWKKSHGLKLDRHRRGKTSYYRIGNDAVHGLCVAWEDSCTIQIVYADIFVVDSRIADTTSAGWRTLAPGEEL